MTTANVPTILVVDDNDIVRKLYRVALAAEGYQVVEAEDGRNALQALSTHEPDLILQDLILPDMGGIDLVRLLREHPNGASIPILAVSGFQSEMELAEKLGVGFTDFLFKPVEPSRLVQTVQTYLPAEPSGSPAALPNGLHLVVADDDPIQLKLARVRLEHLGFKVTAVSDGFEALDALRKEPSAGLITDVLMPNLDGFRLCLAIKQDPELAHIPVVLTSCVYTEPADRQLAQQVGASDLVLRTGDLREVIRALTDAVNRPTLPPDAHDVPTDDYLQRIVHQLERQAEQNRAHTRRLAWLETELAVLASISSSLDGERPLAELLHELLQHCLDGLGLTHAAIFLADDEEHLTPWVELVVNGGTLHFDEETQAELTRVAATLHQPLLLPSIAGAGAEAQTLHRLGLRSLLILPIHASDRLIAAMLLGSDRAEIDEDSVLFARAISQHIASAITQSKSLSRLRRSEERHRHLAEAVPVGIFEADRNSFCTYANPRLEEICGLVQEEILGYGWQRIFRPEDLEEMMRDQATTFATGGEVSRQLPIVRPDGSERWVHLRVSLQGSSEGAPQGITGSVLDITEQRLAEAEHMETIKARHRETQLLFDIGQSLLTEDDLQGFLEENLDRVLASGDYDLGAIRLTNPSRSHIDWIAHRGYRDPTNAFGTLGNRTGQSDSRSQDARVGSTTPTVIEDLPAADRYRSLLREGATTAINVPILDGTARLGQILLGLRAPRPISNDEIHLLTAVSSHLGAAAQKSWMFEDVRRAEQQRETAEEQLRQAQKMEAVGNLAGGVAHDFNNLLTAIIGFGEMALDEDAESAAIRGHLHEIVKAGERAAGLTRQLLAFSRRQVLRPEVINLNAIVENIERMLQRVIGEDIDLQTQLGVDLGYVRADPGQVEQIIVNLAVNARDAMPNGGQLTIEIRNVVLDATYATEHIEVKPGPHVLLSVTDSGSGIPPEVLERIFEPFFTTKEQGKGTGLGLATVFGIVKQSDGHLSVYSEVGIGTTFKIYFPRVDEPTPAEPLPEADAAGSTPTPAPTSASATILLVEDEVGVRALARAVLDAAGYSVIEAASPDEALQAIQHLPRPVDLLITDVVMPGMSGPALAARVSERWPTTKVMLMSGYPGDALRRQGTLDADMPYLEKPFTPRALRAKVQEVLKTAS